MLARSWCGLLHAHEIPFRCIGLPEFDLADPDSIGRLAPEGVTHVVNCAAWTDVDGAEENEPAARTVNADGAGALGAWAARHGAAFVHYSTDYVFNGRASSPYATDAPHDPVSAYGRTKAEGETRVLDAAPGALIVRTSWVYAPWGRNFPRTIARLARERPELTVVDDQHGRPTSAEHLARASLALLLRDRHGVWHVCDAGVCTWHDVAVEIVRRIGADCTVTPCTTEAFPRPAPRPRYSVLDIDATEATLGPMPHWKDNLTDVLRRAAIDD